MMRVGDGVEVEVRVLENIGRAVGAAAAFVLIGWGPAATAAQTCRLVMMGAGPIPVTFKDHRVVVPAEINGRPARVLLDTGASVSILSRSAAIRMGLRLDTVSGLRLYGAGGATGVQAATINLKLAGAERRGMRVVVAGERPLDADMLLGQDVLQQADVEYDLGHGLIRLLAPEHCADLDMPYWAARYDMAPLLPSGDDSQLLVEVKVNGRPARALLDTGAQLTVASPALAARAGVALARPTAEGTYVHGVGAKPVFMQAAAVKTFQIGGETVPNTPLVFADIFGDAKYGETGSLLAQRADAPADLLIGADFFASHRVLVSPSHHKIFFTYEGGPVFGSTEPVGQKPAPASTK